MGQIIPENREKEIFFVNTSKDETTPGDNCWKLHGSPKIANKDKTRNSSVYQATTIPSGNQSPAPLINLFQYNQLIQMLNNIPQTDTSSYVDTSFCLNFISIDVWIIDSGASDHIICNPKFFKRPQNHSRLSLCRTVTLH